MIIFQYKINSQGGAFMAKSNDKQHRTDGLIKSGGLEIPTSMSNVNNPTSAYQYTDKQKIEQQAKANKKF